jgi:hypothetical protein
VRSELLQELRRNRVDADEREGAYRRALRDDLPPGNPAAADEVVSLLLSRTRNERAAIRDGVSEDPIGCCLVIGACAWFSLRTRPAPVSCAGTAARCDAPVPCLAPLSRFSKISVGQARPTLWKAVCWAA